MGAACVAGLRIALQRWPLVLILFVTNLTAGLVFTTVAASWLNTVLDASLATRTLLTDLDMNVVVDVIAHHGEGLRFLLLLTLLLAAVFGVLGVGMHAVTVVAVGEDGGLRESLRRSIDFYPTYFALWLTTLVFDVVGVLAVYWLGHVLVRWTAEVTAEMVFYWILAGGTLLAAAVLLFFATVHDHARIHCVATGTSAARSYVWALRYVGWSEHRAAPLAVVLVGLGVGAWIVYQSVGMLVHATSGVGIAVSLIWGELLLLVRMLLRVWLFAAETELQGLTDRESA